MDEATAENAWYWAVATYKSTYVDKPRRRHLWERTVFLLQAGSEIEAREKAATIAMAKGSEYVGARGDRVRWVMQEVERVQSTGESILKDGTEVYWQFFERVDKDRSDRS